MAIKVIRKGSYNLTENHNNLFNRDLPNQHPIVSIAGLEESLDKKYEKPLSGIPKSDMGFDVAEVSDVITAKAELDANINEVNNKCIEVDIRTTALEDFIHITFPGLGTSVSPPDISAFKLESASIFEEFITEDGDTVFNLSTNYLPGNHSLKVFKDGVLQRLGEDYLETDDNTITFLYPLGDAEYVSFYSESRSSMNSPIHEEYIYDGNNTIVLAYRYNVGDNSLSFFHNGVRLNANREYKEKDELTVELLTDTFTNGDLLVFRRETHLLSNIVHIEDGLDYVQTTWVYEQEINTDGITSITFPQMYIPGSNSIQVFCDGLLLESGINNDYTEYNEHRINFNYTLDFPSTIKIVCAAGMYQWYQTYVSIADQTIFKTQNRYVPNKEDILVYENGLLLNTNEDYNEVNYNTIAFIESPPVGSCIKVYRRR